MKNLKKNTENLATISTAISSKERTTLLLLSDEEAIQYLIDRLQKDYILELDWYLSTLRETSKESVLATCHVSLN